MAIYDWMITACIASLLATAFVHSFAGEKILLKPLFKYRGNRLLENELARMVLRFGWHITSLMWVLLAYILFSLNFEPEKLKSVILISIGLCFLTIGLFDLFASKGKHIGWPLLCMVGIFALLAEFFRNA